MPTHPPMGFSSSACPLSLLRGDLVPGVPCHGSYQLLAPSSPWLQGTCVPGPQLLAASA